MAQQKELPVNDIFDYIICGMGASSMGICDSLSLEKNISILVLEWGDDLVEHNWIDPKYCLCISDGPQTKARYVQGRGVGGSSSLGLFSHHRGSEKDWNRLSSIAKNKEWNYESMNEIWTQIESNSDNKKPIFLTPNNEPFDPILKAIDCDLISKYPSGWKVPTIAAPIIKGYIKRRKNFITNKQKGDAFIEVRIGCFVERVLFAGEYKLEQYSPKKVIGVKYLKDNRIYYAFAKTRVILSCSTLSSCILQRSGIGILNPLHPKIPQVEGNINVGKNLSVPYGIKWKISIEKKTDFESANLGWFESYTIEEIEKEKEIKKRDESRFFLKFSSIEKGFILFELFILDPHHLGEIKIHSNQCTILPSVTIPYFFSNEDVEKCKYWDRWIQKKAIENQWIIVSGPSKSEHSNDIYKEDLYNHLTLSHSYCSSNRIHFDPEFGVVDGNLRVHGIGSLSICDSSVLPFAISPFMASPCYGIGYKYGLILRSEAFMKKEVIVSNFNFLIEPAPVIEILKKPPQKDNKLDKNSPIKPNIQKKPFRLSKADFDSWTDKKE